MTVAREVEKKLPIIGSNVGDRGGGDSGGGQRRAQRGTKEAMGSLKF